MLKRNFLTFNNLTKSLNIAASTLVILGSFFIAAGALKYKNKIFRKISTFERSSSPFDKYSSEYRLNKPERFSGRKIDKIWANKILNGGYLLHFRHAEREKWIDVEKYDALESDVHSNGFNETRYAENEYFAKAVCLNSRGKVQARAIGEHIKNVSLPIGYVISSPSCRARQTANLAFGGYKKLDRDLVHAGPYSEDIKERANNLRRLYIDLPVKSGKNTIISAHNGVIMPQMFDNVNELPSQIELEEGGFYVISNKDGRLILEHEFHKFRSFMRHFYKR